MDYIEVGKIVNTHALKVKLKSKASQLLIDLKKIILYI